MGTSLQLLGFALLALWAALVFGGPAALLVAGGSCLIVSFGVSDVRIPRPRLRRRPVTAAPAIPAPVGDEWAA